MESALAQTHQPCEVIVVDDGSTDDSHEILETYRQRVQLHCLPHQGETATRNFGFSQCTGDLICFLDSDDFLQPHAASRIVACWHPDYTKVQYPLRVVDENGVDQRLLMPRCSPDSGRVTELLLKNGRYITSPGSGNFYPRWFLQKITPVPTDTWPQSFDSYAATYAAFLGPIGAIRDPLGFYRVHRTNMSRLATSRAIEPPQIERLLERQLRLRALIQHLAHEQGLQTNPDIVTSHWLYLKLELARLKYQPERSLSEVVSLLRKIVKSASTAPELSVIKRVQLIMWAIGCAFLPKIASRRILKMGFDLAPESKIVRMMRRL